MDQEMRNRFVNGLAGTYETMDIADEVGGDPEKFGLEMGKKGLVFSSWGTPFSQGIVLIQARGRGRDGEDKFIRGFAEAAAAGDASEQNENTEEVRKENEKLLARYLTNLLDLRDRKYHPQQGS